MFQGNGASILQSQDLQMPVQVKKKLHLDPGIAKYRAVVERTIGKIKFWHVLDKNLWLSKSINHFEQVIFIICNLVNQESFPSPEGGSPERHEEEII